MAYDIRNVKNITDLISYFSQNLGWDISIDDFDDIEDISYDFDAEDIGLKEESFAKISSLRQLQPLVDGQKWGIFCVEFDSNKFEVSALRKILSGLIPRRRNSADHAVWCQQDLLFICNWGNDNNRTIGIAHFEDKEKGLPQIKMISCAPALEDFTQIKVFEDRLSQLAWPKSTSNIEEWRQAWSSAFTTAYRQTIQDSSTLTIQLAAEAQNIRNCILDILSVESKNGYVHLLYNKFRETLIHDMTEQEFADMYAQTVVYGLFSARCMDPTQDDFSAEEAVDCIPNTNPFLKKLMKECLGAQNNSKLSFDELEIGNVVDLLMHTKTDAIISDFNRQTGGGREDPVIHFYEEFLTAYDKMQKVQRGVYYTPQPVVGFIVRTVDTIIKQIFGFDDGLATIEEKKIKTTRRSKKRVDGYHYKQIEEIINVPAIQILDPATGTGTFIRQVILQIYDNFKQKHNNLSSAELNIAWNDYVPKHLLPRVNAFELMMAPYAVAHMKLAMVLRDTGYKFDSQDRLNVYLTNSLEEPGDSNMQIRLFDDPLATEAVFANVIKKNKGINIVIGNPPYSGISANNNPWITKMIDEYKYKHGEYFNERKHWLNDDYVKFIRYAERIVELSGKGIVAYISNNGFLDNPTFRFMRYHLLETFDEIFILNLHGSAKKRETAPDGTKDENVFDIQQGVSIGVFVKKKKSNELAKVYYKDLFGTRDYKYHWLNENTLNGFDAVSIVEPFYSFIPSSVIEEDNYSNGFSPLDAFIKGCTGYLSGKDKVLVADSPEELTDQIISEYGTTVDSTLIKEIEYRPFDKKSALFVPRGAQVDRKIKLPACYRTRYDVMQHFSHDNYALLIGRQGLAVGDIEWNLSFFVNNIPDLNIFYRGGENVFPMYLYSDGLNGLSITANLKKEFIEEFYNKTGIKIGIFDEGETVGVLTLSDYIYAVLNSHSYRKKYNEQLKLDLPKIPFPHNRDYFLEMASIGSKMRNLHIFGCEGEKNGDIYLSGTGTNKIDKFHYKNGKLFINSSRWISGVTEDEWNYYLGGYQPLQKWLKDRKNSVLNDDECQHYIGMINVIRKTLSIMQEIDNVISL